MLSKAAPSRSELINHLCDAVLVYRHIELVLVNGLIQDMATDTQDLSDVALRPLENVLERIPGERFDTTL